MKTLETLLVCATRYGRPGRREACAVLDWFRYKPEVSNFKLNP